MISQISSNCTIEDTFSICQFQIWTEFWNSKQTSKRELELKKSLMFRK